MAIRGLITALVVGAGLATGVQAATYSAVGSYAALPGTATPFSYGYRIGTGAFTAYDTSTTSCARIPGLSCNYASGFNNDTLPAVGKNTTGALITNGSVRIPTDVLFMHPVGPNSGLAAGDTIVRFTAPTGGLFKVSGRFQILDVSASGVDVSILGGSSTFATSLSGALDTAKSFGFRTRLGAGQTLDFVVGSAGSYYNDSTGLVTTIAGVPEASTWALMIAGFGLVGVARRRSRVAAAA